MKTWALILLGSLFFFYGFFQVNMMSALEEPLIREFQTDATTIGLLSGYFFYATVLFILPAGLLLDRFSIRYIMLINMGIAIFGVLLLSFASSIAMASIARFISGIMMAFCMLCSMKRASLLLPERSMSLASSLIVTIGMLGGLSANIVMESLVIALGWRKALLVVAAFGVLIAVILSICVSKHEREPNKADSANVGKSLKEVLKESQNWLCGLFTSMLNLPLSILGALFGISYLMQVSHFSVLESAGISSMLFLGLIVGTACFGWLSDVMGKKRPSMFIGSLLCLFLMLLLLFNEMHSASLFYLLLFAIGFMSGVQVLGYPIIMESNPSHLTATALGFASIMIMGLGYGLGLPFVGWLLDQNWQGKIVEGVPLYNPYAYRMAFLTIPIGIAISFLTVFIIKERRGRKI